MSFWKLTEPQALYRFYVGLATQHGAACTAKQKAVARGIFSEAYQDGYTYSAGLGTYKGASEPVWIVEVCMQDDIGARETAHAIARAVRDALDQECVGFAVIPVSFSLI